MLFLHLFACAADPEPLVTTFSLNVHDWAFPEESAAAVERVLDVHEAAGVPVDVFLTDTVARGYARDAPHVLDRLRDSPVAVVSYHVRPPYPYYPNFDWLGLADLDEDARYAVLSQYETHAVDLVEGVPTIEAGGYAGVAALVGYPPYAVGPSASATMAAILVDMGATFTIDHASARDLGEARDGLYYRPEHVEVKLYEWEGSDPCDVLEDHLAASEDHPETGARYVNVKWHENDLYLKDTPWLYVYFEGGDTAYPLEPPYDTRAWEDDLRPTSALVQAGRWDLYEGGIGCVTADPERWNVTDLRAIAAELGR